MGWVAVRIFIRQSSVSQMMAQARAVGGINFERQMRATIQNEARPLVPVLRQTARTLNITGSAPKRTRIRRPRPKRQQLRATMARNIHGRKMLDGYEVRTGDSWAPFATIKGHWKHPVFGFGMTQKRSRPKNWFHKICMKKSREIQRMLMKQAQDSLKKIPS